MSDARGASPREILTELFHRAVAAADPGDATARAVSELARATPLASDGGAWIIAAGKGAAGMADAAVRALDDAAVPLRGGIVVAHDDPPARPTRLPLLVADHPLPADRSEAAAAAVGEVARQVGSQDLALVLLSGGATSLLAAPIDGVDPEDLRRLYAELLRAGLPIAETNALRKRWSRWGAGRLAVSLAAARTECLVLSDVIGGDLAAIASGPCVGDPLAAADVRALIDRAGLAGRIPAALLAQLDAVSAGALPETPKPGDPRLARTAARVVASNALALRAAAAHAATLGLEPRVADEPLQGEARDAGSGIARALLEARRGGARAELRLWGGETTVTLPADAPPGGRAQELALAAARVLHDAGDAARGITLLCAGTDGRDGPTDAAGAVVDAASWRAIAEAGVDPSVALSGHRAHAALDAAGLLLRTGPTGTNVMDVALALVR